MTIDSPRSSGQPLLHRRVLRKRPHSHLYSSSYARSRKDCFKNSRSHKIDTTRSCQPTREERGRETVRQWSLLPPLRRRLIVNDTTLEQLAVILQENPGGVLNARDEIVGWFGSFGQYNSNSSADEAKWLEVWSGNSFTIDRKSMENPIYVRNPAVSVCGSIQPNVFSRVVNQGRFENGMAQRFLWTSPPTNPNRWSDSAIPENLEEQMESLFEELIDLSMDESEHGPQPVALYLNDIAKRRWREWYDDLSERAPARE